MVVQFFKGGKTLKGAKSAIGYLLNERVKEGTAKVYEGNPDLTLKIISQINRKWKFTSGVISFEESYEEIKKILPFIVEEFERTFFAGLNKDQYNILYVLHTDKGRAELHFIVPRVELTTGKDLAIYTHKKDLKKKDLFQQYINAFCRLSNPLAKEKQETLKIEDRKWSNENKEFKKQLHEIIEQGVVNGLFSNREEIISFLKENGLQIKRQGKDYISIINPNTNKAVRLKGEYYNENWTIDRTIEKVSRREEYTSIVKLGEELRKRVARDAEENRKKYSKSKSGIVAAISEKLANHRSGIEAVQNKKELELGYRRNNYRHNISDDSMQNDERVKNDIVRRDFIVGIRARRAISQPSVEEFEEFVQRAKRVNSSECTADETIKRNSPETGARDREIKLLTFKATATNRQIDEVVSLATATNRQINERIKREYTADEQVIELEQQVNKLYRAFNKFVNTIKRGFELMLNRFKYKHTENRVQQQEEQIKEEKNIKTQYLKEETISQPPRTFKIKR